MIRRILFVAGREQSYSRNHIVFKALQQMGYEVTGCFPPDRSFKHYPRLLLRAARLALHCDLILVGFYGQIILPFLRLLTFRPILFDMYITTLDTMVFDRGRAKPGSLKAKLYGLSDWLSYKWSRLVVLETQSHIDWFCRTFKADPERFRRIFLAVDDTVIKPLPAQKRTKKFLVHFHGEYAPFHGVRYILQAAHLLRGQDIEFQIIGRGITYEADHRLAQELVLPHVRLYDPVPYAELARMMAQADLCLGIFGDNDRVLRVTTNKVVEALAMAKPLVTALNEPVQELLTHLESVFLVERANPQALADAILTMKKDAALRAKIAAGGHDVFRKHCTIERIGVEFARVIKEMDG
ncbi:glycosyltransferase family 4 protein [candidate division KSB1 bacterium]|nr:glycosyltransferase family 4 protein [candidate division KSB1 bacterium]